MNKKNDYTKFLEMEQNLTLIPSPQTETMDNKYFGRCRRTDVEIDKTMGRYSDEYRKPLL